MTGRRYDSMPAWSDHVARICADDLACIVGKLDQLLRTDSVVKRSMIQSLRTQWELLGHHLEWMEANHGVEPSDPSPDWEGDIRA